MNIRIGNEHVDRLLSYPDAANLSGSGESIRGVQPSRVASVLWHLDTYSTIPMKVT